MILSNEEVKVLLDSKEDEIIAIIKSSGYDEKLLNNKETEFYIKAYVLFAHFFNQLKSLHISEIDFLYNKYYWLSKISRFFEKENGNDKGVSQNLFQIIEEMDRATDEIDWKLIENINKGEI